MLKRILVLGGAALLLIGLFLPLVSMPFAGTLNAFDIKDGIGAYAALPCIAAIVFLAVTGKEREAAYAYGAAGAVLAVIFFQIQSAIGDMKASIATELAGNPFRGIVESVADTVKLEWGWIILIAGLAAGLYGALSRPSVRISPERDTAS